jgi:small-conductance mechanosensitive channel
MNFDLNNIGGVVLTWFQEHSLKVILLLVVSYFIVKFSKKAIEKVVRHLVQPDSRLTKDEEVRREDTLIKIFSGTIKVLVIIFATMMILSEVGLDVGPLIAGAGIIGLAIGFGGQYLVKDVITGLFIILENQYRVGDVVTISGISGGVEDITLRVTTLRDADGTVHHIPHGQISTVSNKAKGFAKVNMNIGIAYEADLDHVIKVVNKVGKKLAEDKEFADSIISAPEFVRVDEFADSAIVIKIMGEVAPLKQWLIAGELRKRLKIAFDKEGIDIPYPQRVMITKK